MLVKNYIIIPNYGNQKCFFLIYKTGNYLSNFTKNLLSYFIQICARGLYGVNTQQKYIQSKICSSLSGLVYDLHRSMRDDDAFQ